MANGLPTDLTVDYRKDGTLSPMLEFLFKFPVYDHMNFIL